MTNVPCPTVSGSRRHIWLEYEVKVRDVLKFEPGKGKTGKGILRYRDVESGQHRAVDVEDIVSVNSGRTISRQGKSAHE